MLHTGLAYTDFLFLKLHVDEIEIRELPAGD